MDRLFSDVFGNAYQGSMAGNGDTSDALTYHLPVNIAETEQGYRIEAPVPGFKPEDVEVTFSDGVLSLRATRSEEQTREEGSYIRREISFGNYQRQISLPGEVRADRIKATFDNGVLKVEVPRAPKPEPRRIEVQPGESAKQLEGANAKKK
jgi:HSP20 family protein